jgi:hypothetical protein
LFERRFVLLVDDDEAQVGRGGEHGAAGADDHRHVAAGDRLPVLMALDIGHVAVQHGDAVEARGESSHRLRGEADLRHEYDRLPAETGDAFDGLQVDLGFAAASDAVEQQAAGLLRVEGGEDRGEGGLLVGVEEEPCVFPSGPLSSTGRAGERW